MLQAQAEFAGLSVNDVLKVDSFTILKEHPGGISVPFQQDGVIVTHSLLSSMKPESGESDLDKKTLGLTNLTDNLMIHFVEKNRRCVGFYNSRMKTFRSVAEAGQNEAIGFGVQIIENDKSYFYKQNALWIYDFNHDKLLLGVKLQEPITSNIISASEDIFFAVGSSLFCMEKVNEEVSLVYQGESNISRLTEDGKGGLIFWEAELGLIKVNKADHNIIWTFSPDFKSIENPYLSRIENRLVFSAKDVYCLNTDSGQVAWRSRNGCSKYHYYTRVIGKYVAHYNSCFEEGDSPAVLELLNLVDGKVIANGWVSEEYPELENFRVSEMDLKGLISYSKEINSHNFVGTRGKEVLWISTR